MGLGSWRAFSGANMARSLKIGWWERLPVLPWRIVGEVESADEIPMKLPRNAAVLVVSGKKLKWLAFDCPCHRNHRILLNLDTQRFPHWRVRRDKLGRLTISPSVNALERGTRCHYFIRNGRIAWARS
jgi:Family of unknown function (DUF6527)